MVKGQPKTDLPAALLTCACPHADWCDRTAQAGEVIPLAALKESINKVAYAYTDKDVGPKEEVGNKGGSLPARARSRSGRAGGSNRLRAALKA